MINTTLLWLLALPVILGIIVWVCHRKHADCHIYIGGFVLLAMLIIAIGFFVSKSSKTSDTEIWNGKVVSKERVHGTYEQSYQCNCRTVTTKNSDGSTSSSQVCDTCYETHYTVEWTCNTTVGQYQIDKEDKTTRRVYSYPDPARYSSIQVGDPVAKEHSYTNYIQAVPNSLFTPAAAELKAKFAKLIPEYPEKVYDFYKINRFITPGWAPADAAQWNEDISMALRDRGPQKQVNVIIVVAKTNDPSYEYALTDAWEGVNKNDVVVLIGSTEYPKIDFVRVISWTKNETFKVELRDAIMDKGTIDRSIVNMTMAQIDKNFERRHMKEFEYLDGEIDPPDWLVIALALLVIIGAGTMYVMIPSWSGRGFGRFR